MVKKSPKKSALFATLAVTILAVPAILVGAWGPERPVYDYNKFTEGVSCTDPSQALGRCGSMNGPVFNSFKNAPNYGDERNFNRIANVVPGQSPKDADYGETKQAEAGKEYWVRTYVHNNANETTNSAAFNNIGIAKNTRVKLAIAEGQANGVGVMTYINADNANPAQVYDSSTLVNDNKAFSVNYVTGSAVLYSAYQNSSVPLSDAITSASGVQIGNDGVLNGNQKGCFDSVLYVYVKVKVEAPALEFDKLVRKDGGKSADWTNEIKAKRGDQVEYLLDYKNTGNGTMNNIVLSDKLPTNVTLVPGSVKWIDTNRPQGTPIPDNLLFDPAGVTVGNYGANGGGYIMFEAKVNNEVDECVAKNVAYAGANNVPKQEDDATVIIEDCQPDEPTYSCTSLAATSLGDRKFRFVVNYNAQEATLKDVKYDFGDGSDPLLTTNTTVEYQYNRDGEFTTATTLRFDVDGQEKVVTDPACATTVSTTTPTNNCPIPGKENLPADSPECSLPNTGAGQLFGLFAATTVAGAAAHHVFITRKSSL